jgi:hypothetical protein
MPATPEPVKALRSYDETFLLCRVGNLGHVWSVVGFYRAPNGITCRQLRCERCGTERTDYWNRSTAERYAGRYKYADGYQIPTYDGVGASAADVRREVMRRATVYANEDAMLAAVMKGKK